MTRKCPFCISCFFNFLKNFLSQIKTLASSLLLMVAATHLVDGLQVGVLFILTSTIGEVLVPQIMSVGY
jgi:hypothetical protein